MQVQEEEEEEEIEKEKEDTSSSHGEAAQIRVSAPFFAHQFSSLPRTATRAQVLKIKRRFNLRG